MAIIENEIWVVLIFQNQHSDQLLVSIIQIRQIGFSQVLTSHNSTIVKKGWIDQSGQLLTCILFQRQQKIPLTTWFYCFINDLERNHWYLQHFTWWLHVFPNFSLWKMSNRKADETIGLPTYPTLRIISVNTTKLLLNLPSIYLFF